MTARKGERDRGEREGGREGDWWADREEERKHGVSVVFRSSGESSASQRVVSQLLNEMDGIEPLKQVGDSLMTSNTSSDRAHASRLPARLTRTAGDRGGSNKPAGSHRRGIPATRQDRSTDLRRPSRRGEQGVYPEDSPEVNSQPPCTGGQQARTRMEVREERRHQ
eukprot:756949-Hanusia_phi.AAC.1